MHNCEYCGNTFKTIKTLRKHHENADYCKRSKNISFICGKCNYISKDMKALNAHTTNCNDESYRISSDTLPAQIIKLEDQKTYYEHKSTDLESEVSELNEQIQNLKLKLKMEQFKSNFYSQIITANTDINLSEVIEFNDDCININNFAGGNIPIIVNDVINGEKSKKYNLSVNTKKKNTSKTTYRKVKNVELVEENPEKQEEQIREVDKSLEEIVKENFDISQSDILKQIEILFGQIVSNKIYSKFLPQIKNLRGQLLGRLSLDKYIELTKKHLKRLEKIFKDKNYDSKKTCSIIRKKPGLSPLEQRLLFYDQYYNTRLEPDEIQTLKLALKVNTSYCKRFVPFVRDELYKSMYNYTIALFTVKDTVKRTLVNPYGFPNIVYLDLGKDNNNKDPYSFYTLEKIEDDGRRCWKLELRLDDFSHDLSYHMRKYSITLFRKIYSDIFNDNIYRSDYIDKTIITQQDCQQLLHNILALSNTKQFCNLLRNMIVKHSTIQPSLLDKFNLTSDDRLQKKQFHDYTDEPENMITCIKQLFDDISQEDAQHIIDQIEN